MDAVIRCGSSIAPCSDCLECSCHLCVKQPALPWLAPLVERPMYEVIARPCIASVVLARKVTYLLHTNHGGSVMRSCAFCSAPLGEGGNFGVARMFPSLFHAFHSPPMQARDACISTKQFVASVLLLTLLSHGHIGNVVVGGWSLVAAFVMDSALNLEACISGPRGVFAFDGWASPPIY